MANAPDGLSLRDAIPSDEAEGAALAIEYLQWLCEARGIMPTTEAFQLRSLIALAKWLHGEGDLEKPVVMELVRVQRGSKTLATKGSHAADEAAKWLDWPDYLRLVETLKLECAPLNHAGDQRPDRDVAMAVQRYLLFAILACVPDRQRTLRELELGRTLVCEETDEILDDSEAETGTGTVAARRRRWTVQHAPEDYKTGGAYGARPALVLDPRLYPALEAWLFGPEEDDVPSDPDSGYSDWGFRAALAPSHDRVFTRPNGEAWTVSELSRTFSRAAMRLTGKKTNPHLVRDMVITHVRGAGAGDGCRVGGAVALHGTQRGDAEGDVRPSNAAAEGGARRRTDERHQRARREERRGALIASLGRRSVRRAGAGRQTGTPRNIAQRLSGISTRRDERKRALSPYRSRLQLRTARPHHRPDGAEE